MPDTVVEASPPGRWRRPIPSDDADVPDADDGAPAPALAGPRNRHDGDARARSVDSPSTHPTAMHLAPSPRESGQVPDPTVARSCDRECRRGAESHDGGKAVRYDHDAESSRGATPEDAARVARSPRAVEVDRDARTRQLDPRGDYAGSISRGKPSDNVGEAFAATSSPVRMGNRSLSCSDCPVNEVDVTRSSSLSSPEIDSAGKRILLPMGSRSRTECDADADADADAEASSSKSETPPWRSSRKSIPSESARNNSEPRDGDITLGFNDERYRDIMWRHYNVLGRKQSRERNGEDISVRNILSSLKELLGKGGRFFRRITQSDIYVVVDDEEAVQKITLDITKRNLTIHKWLVGDSNVSCQEESSCHPNDVPLNHHPLPIKHGRACRDNMVSPPMAGPAKFRSTTQSTGWNAYPTDRLGYDNEKPGVGISPPTMHGVRMNAESTLEKLKVSHIGTDLPPLRATVSTKFVQTPNRLIQMLQLATHKLNELHDTKGKPSGRLRLYNLSDLNCFSMGVISDAPSLSELATFMKITPITLKKWYIIYKNAMQRNFDFEKLGEERIKDHGSYFYPEDERYQLTYSGEWSLGQWFQQVGKQLSEEAGNTSEDRSRVDDEGAITSRGPSVLDSDDVGQTVSSEICRLNNARREPAAVLHASNADQLLDTTSPFGQYFQINTACLAKMQSNDECAMAKVSSIQLDSIPKRLKVGPKDRMLCMVLGCERHTQARCNGCCSSHFRMLSTAAASKTTKTKKPSGNIHPKTTSGEMKEVRSPWLGKRKLGRINTQISRPKKNCSVLDRLEAGSRIYVKWNGDNSLYKATVKKTVPNFVKIHYDGKKKHIIDTITVDMVDSIIEGENEASIQKLKSSLVQRAPTSLSLDCAEVSADRSQSPKEVAAVNSLSPMNDTLVNSAFAPPARTTCPPLHYRLSSPDIPNFPVANDTKSDDFALSGRSNENIESEYERPKRNATSIEYSGDQDCHRTRSKEQTVKSKSVLCNCYCGKGSLSVQGMYAHHGRAHAGKIAWDHVTFSCPFCPSNEDDAPLILKSFPEVEAHINATHPGLEIAGPHRSKSSRGSIPAQKSSREFIHAQKSSKESIPEQKSSTKYDRVLRERKEAHHLSGVTKNDKHMEPKVVAKEQGPSSWSKIGYVQLLSDGKKQYPRDLGKVIEMVEDQCHAQEEIVEAAREQRMNLCRNEAEIEKKAMDEERLVFQRGIRERARLADCERIEKQKYIEKAEQIMMFYQYENRNKGRHKEDIEIEKLCTRSIHFSSGTQRPNTRHGNSCEDDQCLFCNKAKGFLHHLLLDNEIEGFKMDAPATESPLYQHSINVLNPLCHVIDDSFYSEVGGTTGKQDDGKEPTGGSKRSNQRRRDASTAKRVNMEEDKLLTLKNTKHCLEFIKKYNEGMIISAWGESRKDNRGRRVFY